MHVREQRSPRTPIFPTNLPNAPRWFPLAQVLYRALGNPLIFAIAIVLIMIAMLAL